MARQRRFDVPGLPQHVIQRGNNRSVIFGNEADLAYFHKLMVETTKRCGVAVHAYVFMTNHIHLLATPGIPGAVGKTMQSLGRRYVQYFNRRYHRSGTLWEGRYRATVVDEEKYLLACYRYIELNPVRAEMVALADDFSWSSFRRNATDAADELVTSHPIYEALGQSATQRTRAYRALFKNDLSVQTVEELRERTNKGWVLGGSKFRAEVEALTQRQTSPKQRGGDRRSIDYRDRRTDRV